MTALHTRETDRVPNGYGFDADDGSTTKAMSIPRQRVLEALVDATDTEGRETTSPAELAASLGVGTGVVEAHLDALVDCGLAQRSDDGVRMTRTAQELLDLDVTGTIVLDCSDTDGENRGDTY